MIVGVMAIQGDFAAHGRSLASLGASWREVRRPDELAQVDALVLPGGESTTMLLGLDDAGLWGPLAAFAQSGKPIMGTCAGAILLAKEVTRPEQRRLGVVDITIERNGYGRQVDSFIAMAACEAAGQEPLEMVFIRAPIIRRLGPSVKVLAEHDGHPVLVEQGDQYLVATFHPELSGDARVHRLFLEKIGHS